MTEHRKPHMMILAMGVGLALMLYTHGAWWWFAPFGLLAIVLAHVAILGGLAFDATRGGHSRSGASMLLHRPRQFDVMARVITLGGERKLRQWTLDLADLQPDSVVLDVGCGTGTLLLAAAERLGSGGALFGVEPSPEMATHARRKAEGRRVPLEIVEGSADRLPYPQAMFDAVFCTLVFHHLPRSLQESAIREICRVLRPGGRAVIVDWQRPTSLARALASPLFLVYLVHYLGPHRSPLDVPGIEPLMTDLGFADIIRHPFRAGGAVGAVVALKRNDGRVED